MPLKNYGVLKGRPIGRRLATHANAHYQVQIIDNTTDYRIAVNVQSKISPSELEYVIDDRFAHPLTDRWTALPLGWTRLDRQADGGGLDFIRSNLFDRERMRRLPFDVPGADNDLNEFIDRQIQRAMADEDALIYAFGERWGPEPRTKDKIFGFLPGNGVHDIHMNQGNHPSFADQDGVWQDGGLLIQFPHQQQWVAIFLKFQSQVWHTDDRTGHALVGPRPDEGEPTPIPVPEGIVQIVAALVNPPGADQGHETVTLLNTTPEPLDLGGWTLADRMDQRHRLAGVIPAGATLAVTLPLSVQLGNQGGIISLLNSDGLKIHGVAYTKEQARRQGWTIVF